MDYYTAVVNWATNFIQSNDFQNIVTLAIALLVTGFVIALLGRNRRKGLRSALRAEIKSNIAVTAKIVQYADAQLSGDTSVAPMPRYRKTAFMAYAGAGLMERLHVKIANELEQLYLSMESVNKASRRQEELAFGPAAAFPNAHTLRLENLTYARDTAHNVIEPYQDRLREVKF